MSTLLLISVIVIATCGLVYELIAGTAASYLLGDSVTQFSTVIGCYLFAMGAGSWISKYVTRNLIGYFVRIEILVGLAGGCSAMILFLLFDQVASFRVLLYFLVAVIGVLVGAEIPLLLRILKDRFEFRDLVSRVLALDYLGALFASVLFPLLLVPYLGLVKSAFLFGMLNTGVAVWAVYALKDEIPALRAHRAAAIGALLMLTFGFVSSEKIMSVAESMAFPGRVIFSQSTPYQRIVLTKAGQDLRLFLNSNLQFSSVDEYRYHEALVHPAMAAHPAPKSVLVIGGGDGLAVREVLKYEAVEKVTLVDLDPAMTELFSGNELLTALNKGALRSPKVEIVSRDAFIWLRERLNEDDPQKFDVIISDVPDPSNFSIGKLYSRTFFAQIQGIMKKSSLLVVQSTSPLVARKSFWCVNNTMEDAGFKTAPYHAYVPAFGEWGYVLAGFSDYRPPEKFLEGLRFVTAGTAAQMFSFPPDMARLETKIQRLDDQALVRYFDQEWSEYLVY